MHYANGREAKNGDKVVMFSAKYTGGDGQIHGGTPIAAGILYDAQPGNDYCNGRLAITSPGDPMPNLKDCLHADDVAAAVSPDSIRQG